MLPPDFLGWLTFILKHLGPLIILAIGCLCVYALQQVADLRSTPLFCIIRVMMLIDIINTFLTKIHDIPTEIVGKELFGPIAVNISIIVQCIRWFANLLVLPMLSSLHILSLYKPVKFRSLRLIHGYVIVGLFLSASVMLTIPLFTECCGYTYYVNGAFWAFDFGKPGTALYTQLNIYLQGICVIMMLICDVFILYKVYNMRPKAVPTATIKRCLSCLDVTQQTTQVTADNSANTTTPIVRAPIRQTRKAASIEKKLTMAFLLLSLSFILPTVGFNLRPAYQDWYVAGLIGAVCLIVENFKWFAYTLTTTLIRNEFVRILKCQRLLR